MDVVVFWYYLVISIMLEIILYVKCNIYGCKNAVPIGILNYRNTKYRRLLASYRKLKYVKKDEIVF